MIDKMVIENWSGFIKKMRVLSLARADFNNFKRDPLHI